MDLRSGDRLSFIHMAFHAPDWFSGVPRRRIGVAVQVEPTSPESTGPVHPGPPLVPGGGRGRNRGVLIEFVRVGGIASDADGEESGSPLMQDAGVMNASDAWVLARTLL